MTHPQPAVLRELDDLARRVEPIEEDARAAARSRQGALVKPLGALGLLEPLGEQLAGIARRCPPPVPAHPAVAVFAADHGVHAQGVTPWPQSVSVQMAIAIGTGRAVVNALAAGVGAGVTLVDIGLAGELPDDVAGSPHIVRARVADGTADLSQGPAMTREQAAKAVLVGIDVAHGLVDGGADLLVTGDMGIANTTASAALIAAMTGSDPALVTGRGAGVDEVTLTHKKDVVRQAVDLHAPDPEDPLDVLARLGGLEHAGIVGLLLGGALEGVPVILDGVIADAAALVAAALAPAGAGYWIAGHRSAEPGARVALEALGARALLDLDLRLGEGSGGVLAVPVVQAAARVLTHVATLDEMGIAQG